MLISIIMPVYNSSKYIKNTLDSILDSFKSEIELIIIDDGSTDDTLEICKKMTNGIPNVRIIKNSNHGVSYTRNYGLEISSGEFVMFLDSDDRLQYNWYDIVIDEVKRNKDTDFFVFSQTPIYQTPSKKEIVESIIGITKQFSTCYLPTPWSKVFKRSFLIKNHICFDENISHGEDAIFNMKSIIASEKYRFIDKSIYIYRISNCSVTHNFNSTFLESNKLYLQTLSMILEKTDFLSEREIDSYITYSFQNSMYIYAGKVSKLKKLSEKKKAIKQLYNSNYYKENLSQLDLSPYLSRKKRIIYKIIADKYFLGLELALSVLRRKSPNSEDSWIEI